jgi:hypothetical protein
MFQVNFLESLITFTTNLTDEFQIDEENGVVVNNKEKNKATDNVGCEVIAYESTSRTNPHQLRTPPARKKTLSTFSVPFLRISTLTTLFILCLQGSRFGGPRPRVRHNQPLKIK